METTFMYHRGGGKSLGYPPNCIRTIEWAVNNGAKGIEYDVVAAETENDYIIVMIEPGLVEEEGLDMDDLQWKDLEGINTGNEKTGRCPVARLTEVLKLIDQTEIKQQIHIKGENPATIPTLMQELDDLTNITITSFDLNVLEEVRETEPEVELGWIVKPDSKSGSEGTQDLTKAVTSNPGSLNSYTEGELQEIKHKAERLEIDTLILCAPKIGSKEIVETFREEGFDVGAWGVGSNLDTAERMISLGIDRFTIDNPEEMD